MKTGCVGNNALKSRTASSAQPFLLSLLITVFVLGLGMAPTYGAQNDSSAILRGVTSVPNTAGQPLMIGGVQMVLSGTSSSSAPLTTFSDSTGAYEFPDLQPGGYTLKATLEGFQAVSKTVSVGTGETVVENIGLELEEVRQQVEVHASAPGISQQSSSPPATITGGQLMALPVAPQNFKNVLPLVPGVIRTPDKKLHFKGETENQGMMLVDGTQMVDPITGSFAIKIPVDAIETLKVYDDPADAQFGSFSGGLTSVRTKPPEGRWNYSLHDFLPGIRGRSGHIVGISDDIPRLVFGGPIINDKLNFSENFQYEINKEPVRGLAWPHNETKTQGFDSFTIFQAILSPQHLLTVKVNVFPLRTQFADINALVPQTASSDFGERGVWISGGDSYQFNSGALLATQFTYLKFDGYAHGQGPVNMVITPDGWGGNFFNSWTRFGDEEEALPVFEFPAKQWYGRHSLKVGLEFTRRSFTGDSQSHPVRILRENGTLAEQIDFAGGNALAGEDTEVTEFAQDHWSFGERTALDLGLRMTSQSRGRSAALAPRAGLVYSPGLDGKTVIRVGGGIFYDRIPLLGTDFTQNPVRTLNFYGLNGASTGAPLVLPNIYLRTGNGQPAVLGANDLGTSPRNFSWDFEVDREVSRRLEIQAKYLFSETHQEFVVSPVNSLAGNSPTLALMPTGGSHYHAIEAIARYRPNAREVLNISYVHSRARGDLNTLTDIYVPFEAPVIRPDAVSYLNSDIPNRVVAWGVFDLPWWGLRFSPVVDVHSGFPYSNIDTFQNYAGTPNAERFPAFASFDWKVSRVFHLPVPIFKSLRQDAFRFGIYYTNFLNHSNPLEIFNNVTSPNFGQFVGFQHRVAGFVVDLAD
jgi:Carboxypeptidase regulatory-like domain